MPQHPQHRILVTAGPTFEALDCVRSISNHSSGRLGGSIALAAAIAGHETTLLLGPGSAATAVVFGTKNARSPRKNTAIA